MADITLASLVTLWNGGTVTNNIDLGNGVKIRGDFASGTLTNRPGFQSNVTNSDTAIPVVPNGTSKVAGITLFGDSDVNNANYINMLTGASAHTFIVGNIGTATLIPFQFRVNSTISATMETTGAWTFSQPVSLSVGAQSSNPFSITGDFTSTGRFIGITNTNTGTVSQMGIQLKAGSGGGSYLTEFALEYTSNATQTGRFSMVSSNNGLLFNASGASGDHLWTQGGSFSEVMRLTGTALKLGSPVKSIVADFGNTTAGSRAQFSPIGTNDYCVVGAVPNGTGTLSIFRAWGTSDIANSHSMDLYATTTETFINSGYTGTGTQRDIGVKFQGSLKYTFGSAGTFTAEDGPIATKGATACVNFYDRTGGGTPWVGYVTSDIFRLYRAGDKWTINSAGDVSMTGDLTLANGTSLTFTQGTLGYKLLFWSGYNQGIQTNNMYFRVATGGGFQWYVGGVHNDAAGNGGGGVTGMSLSTGGALDVNNTITAGNSIYMQLAASGVGLYFWDTTGNYRIHMSSATDATWGGRVAGETTSDYNMYFKMTSGTNRGFVFMNGANARAGIDGAGNVRAVGDITAFSSDGRLKKNKKRITNALAIIRSKSGYSYDWDMPLVKSLGLEPQVEHEHGLIAQEWLDDAPDVVRPAPFNADYFTIKYDRITPFLLEGVKELDDKYETIRAELETLKAQQNRKWWHRVFKNRRK